MAKKQTVKQVKRTRANDQVERDLLIQALVDTGVLSLREQYNVRNGAQPFSDHIAAILTRIPRFKDGKKK